MISPIIFNDEEFRLLTEEDVPNIDSNRYLVSNRGNVFDKKANRFVSISSGKELNSYRSVYVHTSSGYVSLLVHRLVGIKFIPGDRSLTINHKDGCKYHNYVDNLEWATQRENLMHALDTGLNYRGEDKPNAILSNIQVESICKCLEDGLNYDDIIAHLKLEDIPSIKRILADIKRKRSWKTISSKYNIPKEKIHPTRIFSDSQAHQICKLLENDIHISTADILSSIGITNYSDKEKDVYRHAIQSIKFKDAYMDISSNYNW